MSPEFVCNVCLSAAVKAKSAQTLLPINHYECLEAAHIEQAYFNEFIL